MSEHYKLYIHAILTGPNTVLYKSSTMHRCKRRLYLFVLFVALSASVHHTTENWSDYLVTKLTVGELENGG